MAGAASARQGRRAENRQETERTLLQAAEEVFAERGFAGATTQMIAERAGLPKANLHYYFPTKEALYRQVVSNIFEVWLEAADSFDATDDPVAALSAYIDTKMALSRSRPNGSKVWANEVMHGAPVIQDYLETTLRDWTESRAAIIRRWIAEGRIAPVEPRHLLYMIWATTQHYADFGHQVATLNGGRPLSDAEWRAATEDVKRIILAGIGARPAAEGRA